MIATRLLLVLAAAAPRAAQNPVACDELLPSRGVFDDLRTPSTYDLALRRALLGADVYRKCQMLVVPSFAAEWCVFIRREEGTRPELICRRMKESLYSGLMDAVSSDRDPSVGDRGAAAEARALELVKIELETSLVFVRPDTADLLEEVWWRMLGRVRYPEKSRSGKDGTTYHFAQWIVGAVRSGEAWSPDEGTRVDALVTLGEHMRDLAIAEPDARTALEDSLVRDACSLLDRIEKASADHTPR